MLVVFLILNTGEEKNFSKPNFTLSSESNFENVCVRGLNCLIGWNSIILNAWCTGSYLIRIEFLGKIRWSLVMQ